MDNVTHSLFALTLARTPLGRERGATAALASAPTAPDSDFLVSLTGASYLDWHRGPTHGPLGILGLGLVTAACVYGISRAFNWQPERDGRTQFAHLLMASMIGVAAHILMDLPTSYGT